MFSASPFCVINPSRAAISCNTIVAMIDKTNAQSKLKPKLTPATEQTVTVPGPIKAAATSEPGPKCLKKFILNFKRLKLLVICDLFLTF